MPQIFTTLARPLDGEPEQFDVMITYDARCTSRGCAATYWQPAEADEWDVTFVSAEFDGGEPEDAPGPITEAELAELRQWFAAHEDEATRWIEIDDGPDPDEARERMLDERGESW